MSDALDDIAELEALRRQAEDLSQRLAAGEREAAESSARDSREAVRVSLGRDGHIASVEVFPQWRRQLAAGQLGAAIVEAAEEAARRRSEAWAHGVAHSVSGEVREPAPDADPTVASTREPVDDSAVDYARNLLYVLRDSYARLDDLESETEQAALSQTTASDPDGRVRVTLDGERLSAVSVDHVWLRSASAVHLGAATTQALQQAYANRKEAVPLRRSWPYNELERITADPAQLLANLGLAPRQIRRSD
ncbi:hypothetical protein [Micromonospora sp. NPDC049374]|uniref:hypothetical protein n=1 Tax=Micromonospora sp. NPDC049374 TaxID=3154352 RepID=UPI003445DCDE